MDPVSAAAGAVSFVSLAIQLFDKVQEVRNFWRSIKDAPAEVNELIRELDCILGILQGINELDDNLCLQNDGPLVETLRACEMHIGKVSATVHDLKGGFAGGKTSRTWTSLRFTLRKGQIKSSQEALERVKSNLMLAQTIRQE